MELDFDYADSCLPDKVKMFGRTLRDFSIGHLLLLQRIRSPYIADAKTASFEDLLTAVQICTVPYSKAVKLLWSGNSWRVRIWARAWAIVAQFRPQYVYGASCAFEDYLAKARRDPRGVFKNGDMQRSYAPFVALFAHDLASQYSFAELLEQPLRKLIFERFHLLTMEVKGLDWPWHLRPQKQEVASGN